MHSKYPSVYIIYNDWSNDDDDDNDEDDDDDYCYNTTLL